MAQRHSPSETATPTLTLSDLPLSRDEQGRAELVDFSVDREGELPLGPQLAWKLRAMIARGALGPSDRLPSVRELAAFAGVNVNTARAVYAELEEEGLIASEHGRGTFVVSTGDLREVGDLAAGVLEQAREAELDPRQLAGVLAAVATRPADDSRPTSPLQDPGRTLTPAEHRQVLREQIARLESELADHAWEDHRRPAPPRPLTAEPTGRIASVEELERTRDALVDRLTRLREEGSRRGAGRQQARARLERMLEDPAGHRWEIVSSDQLGEPGDTSWQVLPRFGPLGAIMGWWRVRVTS